MADLDGLGADGWNDLVGTFESWGLPAPPVPVPLRPALRWRQNEAVWATREGINGEDMYRLRPGEIEEFLTGKAADYVAVSHAGHGINSYAINFYLVYQGLAVFVQWAWGGAYMDNNAEARGVARMFDLCSDLIEQWERQRPRSEPRRLLCLDGGELGHGAACGWLPTHPGPDTTVERFLRDHDVDDDWAVERAAHLLASRS